MTRHVLILGNNLTGLATAYRLLHYGFHISIIDTQSLIRPTGPSRVSLETIGPTSRNNSASIQYNQSIPLILHGFCHTTWALLQELSFEWPSQISQSVCLEFGTEKGKPIALPKPSRLAWLNPLTRLTFFKGLSWSDRWNFINFLEKQWEENRLPHHNPDIESAEAWLISAKQSEYSRSKFWNPLCRFFLSCDLPEASLGSFIELLSRYWFSKPTDAATFLAPCQILFKLETELRQLLINKGVRIHPSNERFYLHTDTEGIQSIELGDYHFKAQVYISALAPRELLSLLPERTLAHYAYFSSLDQIPEVHGLAIRFTLHDGPLTPRLIIHSDQFDWITSQPSSQSRPETAITCVTLRESMVQEQGEGWLIDAAWLRIQNLFNISPTQSQESSEPQVIRQTDPYFPYCRGSRTHRPLPKTPIPNFFLAGPWTATNAPSFLESTIQSANACAEAVATSFYGNLD